MLAGGAGAGLVMVGAWWALRTPPRQKPPPSAKHSTSPPTHQPSQTPPTHLLYWAAQAPVQCWHPDPGSAAHSPAPAAAPAAPPAAALLPALPAPPVAPRPARRPTAPTGSQFFGVSACVVFGGGGVVWRGGAQARQSMWRLLAAAWREEKDSHDTQSVQSPTLPRPLHHRHPAAPLPSPSQKHRRTALSSPSNNRAEFSVPMAKPASWPGCAAGK